MKIQENGGRLFENLTVSKENLTERISVQKFDESADYLSGQMLCPRVRNVAFVRQLRKHFHQIKNLKIFESSFTAHIAQNIAETFQKYFQSFFVIEILPQHFFQLFQNISLQHYNYNFLKYFSK